MQNYSRIYDYIQEYQRLVYDVYSKHAPAYLVTYYHINKDDTVWDDDTLFGGAYEQLGSWSGIKFDKYLLLPIYFLEEVLYNPTAEESGVVRISESHIVLPSTYGINPLPHDLVKFTRYPIDIPLDGLYSVTGFEHSETTPYHLWKLKLINEQNFSPDMADKQVQNTYIFYDYDKKVHESNDATTMTRLLSKNESIRSNLNNLFDQNSGLYFI